MENSQTRRSYQFLVRLWSEDLGEGEHEWRGKALNIANGEASYFRDWQGLVLALQKILEPAPAEVKPPESQV